MAISIVKPQSWRGLWSWSFPGVLSLLKLVTLRGGQPQGILILESVVSCELWRRIRRRRRRRRAWERNRVKKMMAIIMMMMMSSVYGLISSIMRELTCRLRFDDVHLWYDVINIWSIILLYQISFWMSKCFSSQSLDLLQLLTSR